MVAATLIAVALTAGCGRDEEREPTAPVTDAPGATLTDAPGVATAKASVVRIESESPNCITEGSGFVAAPNRVMTPAQIVAGADDVTVELDGKSFGARVVSYDPARDLAILDVANLPAAPLSFAPKAAENGSDAIALGFADRGDFTVVPLQIREVINLSGPDIYREKTVSREVYTIKGNLKDTTGGPVINSGGEVLGVSFGVATNEPDTGFALTAREIEPQLTALANTEPVSTGRERC